MLDAIVSTLHRLFVTRKRLLQWTTSAHTVRLFGRKAKFRLLWRKMGLASLLAWGLTCLVSYFAPDALLAATPLLFMALIENP